MPTMRDRLYRWLSWSPLFFLACLAALTFWLDAQIKAPAASTSATRRHAPDLFINDFQAVQFNAQGVPQQQLKARYAEHFADDDSIEFDAPHITLQNPDQPRFTITAKSARLTGDKEDLYFRGNVEAVRDAPATSNAKANAPANEPLTLRTEYLHVRPNDNTLQTDQLVMLDSPSGHVEAVGMSLNRDTSTLVLNSKIKGTFQPQPRQ